MLRLIIKKIAGIKFDFNINTEDEQLYSQFASKSFDIKGYAPVNNNKSTASVINAAFANRFVLIPFKTMASVLLQTSSISENDQLQISSWNNLHNKLNKPDEYIKEYKYWVKRFYGSIENSGFEELSVISEEINHNAYLKGTTSYSALQVLTLLIRFLNTFLTDNDFCKKSEYFDEEVWSLFVNSYLVRSWISTVNMPIIEAEEHIDANIDWVSNAYSQKVSKTVELLRGIRLKLSGYSELEGETNLLEECTKAALNFPFASFVQNHGLDFENFKIAYSRYPSKVLMQIDEFLTNNDEVTAVKFRDYISKLQSKSSIDYKFSNALLYHGLSKNVPQRVLTFILRRALTTKYIKVVPNFFTALLKGPDSEIDKSYSKYPAFKAFGLRDEVFNMDPEMKLFNNNAFLIALMSFEPSLLKEKKIVDILNSKITRTLLIRNAYMKALFYAKALEVDFTEFSQSISYLFEVRPIMKNNREAIINLVNEIYSEVSVLDSDDVKSVSKSIKHLVDTKYRKLEQNPNSIEYYRILDVLYAHGF